MYNIVKYNIGYNKNFFNFKVFNNFIFKIFIGFIFINTKKYIKNSKNLLIVEVLFSSNKKEIVYAAELIFGIKVLSINTLIKKKSYIYNGFTKKKLKKKAFINFIKL